MNKSKNSYLFEHDPNHPLSFLGWDFIPINWKGYLIFIWHIAIIVLGFSFASFKDPLSLMIATGNAIIIFVIFNWWVEKTTLPE